MKYTGTLSEELKYNNSPKVFETPSRNAKQYSREGGYYDTC
jgi:hypothetical protein